MQTTRRVKRRNLKIVGDLMKFKYALVREPGDLYKKCITSHPQRASIDINVVRKQHVEYCNTLEELGLELIKLPRLNEYPDSCFIEDTAIIHNSRAFVTRMGAIERRGEVSSVESILKEFMEVNKALEPARIEGGDVIHLEDYLISGITKRSNQEGINQMSEFLEVEVLPYIDPEIVHLKSYITYLGKNTFLMTKKYANQSIFEKFEKIIVDTQEEYAANTLTINETVIMAEGYENAQMKIKEAGFDVLTLKTTEFQKCEGALTCLSLLF
jgi:dimethylargininase